MKAQAKIHSDAVWKRATIGPVVALGLWLGVSCFSAVQAQILLSDFEVPNNTQGWTPAIPTDFPQSTYLEHQQVSNSGGQTEGTGALRVEFRSSNGTTIGGSGFAVRLDASGDPNNPGLNSDLYNAFNIVAAADEDWFLEFDATILPDEWSNFIAAPSFSLDLAVNSDVEGDPDSEFHQIADLFGNIAGATGTFHGRVPMSQIRLAEDSSFFQLSFGSHGQFAHSGGPTQGPNVYFDNIRFTPAPPTIEETLFSWETPDNPGTPGVDERFEGWSDAGLDPETEGDAHTHSIATVGNTHGTKALQINREGEPGFPFPPGPTFYWGSTFRLDADANNPAIQAKIDDLVATIGRASAIAFDVRYDEGEQLYNPTFTRFAVAFQGGNNGFFQAEGQSFDGTPDAGLQQTIIIQTSSMLDATDLGLGALSDVGLGDGTYFQLAFATNTDGGIVYQIDNFRAIIDLSTADFDNDFDVDGSDFLIWQRHAGMTTGAEQTMGDTDRDGDVDGVDLATWKAQYGTTSGSQIAIADDLIQAITSPTQVPEPSTLVIAAVTACLACSRRRRGTELLR